MANELLDVSDAQAKAWVSKGLAQEWVLGTPFIRSATPAKTKLEKAIRL